MMNATLFRAFCGTVLTAIAVSGGATAQVPGSIPFMPAPPATGVATYSCNNGSFTAQFVPSTSPDCVASPGSPRVTVSCSANGLPTPTITGLECGKLVVIASTPKSRITVKVGKDAQVELQNLENVTVELVQGITATTATDIILKGCEDVTVSYEGGTVGTLTLDDSDECTVNVNDTKVGPNDIGEPVIGEIELVVFTNASGDNKVNTKKGSVGDVSVSSSSAPRGNKVNGKKVK